jgi:hypothetical protein
MNSRLASIIRKEFIQITRDKRTLVIILIIPIMQLFLLGYSATSDVRNVPLAVFDQCRCAESRSLLDAYRAADYFKLAYDVGSENDIRTLIEQGKARAGVIIPPDYDARLAEGNAQVAFILDGSDAVAGSTALAAATLIGQQHADDGKIGTVWHGCQKFPTPARGPDPGLVQPGPGQLLLHDPRRDRHDPVCHHRHPDRDRSGA